MNNLTDIYFNGVINNDGIIELQVVCNSGSSSTCEEIILPGETVIGGKHYKAVLTHESLKCLKKVKIIRLSNGLKIKSGFPFYFCESLEKIIVDDDNEDYCSINGVLFNKDRTQLIWFPGRQKPTNKYPFPKTLINCEQIVSRYPELNIGIERIIKERGISSILTSLLIGSKTKVKNNPDIKVERTLEFWGKELNKCSTVEQYNEYIAKYNDPSNIFLSWAKRRRDSLTSKQDENKRKNKIKLDDIKAYAYCLLMFVLPVVIGIGIRSWYEDYKESQKHGIKVHTPSINNSLINSHTIDEMENDNDISDNPTNNRDNNTISYPNANIRGYSPNYPVDDVTEDNSRWDNYYRNAYSEMERQAKRDFNSLCNLGSSYEQNGNMYGSTGRNDSYIASQISQFRQLQNRMRDLRYEASQKNVNIQQSYWETAQVNL